LGLNILLKGGVHGENFLLGREFTGGGSNHNSLRKTARTQGLWDLNEASFEKTLRLTRKEREGMTPL